MNLKKSFSEISNLFDTLYNSREKILRLSRNIVRDCSIGIKHIHRKEFSMFQEKKKKIKIDLETLNSLVNTNPAVFSKFLKTPEQEYTELIVFYSIVDDQEIPSPSELKISPINFALGLADVIGELRRYALDNIRNSQTNELNKVLESMDEIYTSLFSVDYPVGLTQDLRHKVDVARNIIEKTRGDISLAIQMNDLKQCFENEN
ncbi:MAG: haloacid dehalogenase [Promethearchaeota archaeon]|jgi:translin